VPNFVHRSTRYPNIAIFSLSSWQPSAILDFQKVEILRVGKVKKAEMRHTVTVQNFAAIGQTVAEIWPFFHF